MSLNENQSNYSRQSQQADTDNQQTNQNSKKIHVASGKRGKTRANKSLVIGFGFTSDWLINRREIFKPITKHSNAKPKQFRK